MTTTQRARVRGDGRPTDNWVNDSRRAEASAFVDEACLVAIRRLPAERLVHRCLDADLTVGLLLERVNLVAEALVSLNVGRGDVVSLKSRRDSWLLPVILGVLSTGAAYHVIPFNSPQSVEDAALETIDPVAVVAWDKLAPASWEGAPTTPLRDHLRILRSPSKEPSTRIAAPRSVEDVCYVCATSGTSGRPKCTAVPHRSVVSFLLAAEGLIRLETDDLVAARSSAAFDLSVWELFAPLLAGCRAVLVPEAVAADTPRLHQLLAEERCTVLSTTPSAAYQLGAHDVLENGGLFLRRLLVGGEASDGARLQDVMAAPSFLGCRLDNWYGPTETTVSVTGGQLTHERLQELDITIGPALAGVELAVVTAEGHPATTGELLVAGAQVAHGYIGDPRATASAFVPGHGGARLYRTGDIARIDGEGWVTYLGRQDSQVQLRGYRLELSEVERALATQPNIRWCHAGVGGTEKDVLLAWYARRDPTVPFDREATLRDLYARLPRHAVPAALIEVDEIPVSEGQKLATHLLPHPTAADFAGGAEELVLPSTGTEAQLLEVWRRLLDVEEISVTHHFFDVGGHSLLAARLLATVRKEFGVQLALAEAMDNLRIRDLARLVDEHVASAEPSPN